MSKMGSFTQTVHFKAMPRIKHDELRGCRRCGHSYYAVCGLPLHAQWGIFRLCFSERCFKSDRITEEALFLQRSKSPRTAYLVHLVCKGCRSAAEQRHVGTCCNAACSASLCSIRLSALGCVRALAYDGSGNAEKGEQRLRLGRGACGIRGVFGAGNASTCTEEDPGICHAVLWLRPCTNRDPRVRGVYPKRMQRLSSINPFGFLCPRCKTTLRFACLRLEAHRPCPLPSQEHLPQGICRPAEDDLYSNSADVLRGEELERPGGALEKGTS